MVRKAYVALLPTDPKARRQELVALANVLAGHINDGDVKQLRWKLDLIETLDEPDPTPSPTRRTKKKTYPAKRAGMSRADSAQAAGSPADPPATPPGLGIARQSDRRAQLRPGANLGAVYAASVTLAFPAAFAPHVVS
jgi:hypothetical protein